MNATYRQQKALWIDPRGGIEKLNQLLRQGWLFVSATPVAVAAGRNLEEQAWLADVLVIVEWPTDIHGPLAQRTEPPLRIVEEEPNASESSEEAGL